jgi:hypothetical protein
MAGRIFVEENKSAEPTVFLYAISMIVRMKYGTISTAPLNTSSHSSTDSTTVRITAVANTGLKNVQTSVYTTIAMEKIS